MSGNKDDDTEKHVQWIVVPSNPVGHCLQGPAGRSDHAPAARRRAIAPCCIQYGTRRCSGSPTGYAMRGLLGLGIKRGSRHGSACVQRERERERGRPAAQLSFRNPGAAAAAHCTARPALTLALAFDCRRTGPPARRLGAAPTQAARLSQRAARRGPRDCTTPTATCTVPLGTSYGDRRRQVARSRPLPLHSYPFNRITRSQLQTGCVC